MNINFQCCEVRRPSQSPLAYASNFAKRTISFLDIVVKQNNFSQEFKFPKNILNSTAQKTLVKINFLDIEAETKSFSISNDKKKCYCKRDFTVEEMQSIVEGIRDNTYYNEQTITSFHGNKLFHRNSDTRDLFNTELVPEEDQTFKKLTEVLNKYFKMYKIDKCIQKIHFLAQMYAETEYFTKTIEGNKTKLSYDPERGRGFMHLTHDYNYITFKKDTNIDIVAPNYDKVAKDLDISAHTACWFWSVRGKLLSKKGFDEVYLKTSNEIALYVDKYIDGISRAINGGTYAINERKVNYLTLKNLMKYEECNNKK